MGMLLAWCLVSDNTKFASEFVCAAEFESACMQHLKSDHTKKLLEFDTEKGVVFKLEPLLIID